MKERRMTPEELIEELEKENTLLKGRNEGFEKQIMGLLIKYEEFYKRFPDLKSAMDKAAEVLKENAELKEENKRLTTLVAKYMQGEEG
jgi:FtsZ-binding cell division protein ZapB